MVCVYCGSDTEVVNSRPKKLDNAVWRRRLCVKCSAVLTTFEKYDLRTAFMVKKRSGALQSFQRDKLLISIARSIDHKNNSSQAASSLAENVLRNLLKNKPVDKIITSSDISNVTSLALKRYDPSSSIKYLSFQRPYQSAKDIKKLLN